MSNVPVELSAAREQFLTLVGELRPELHRYCARLVGSAIDGDRLKLGFKYGDGFWSTVIWVELRVWLVKEEKNVVAVEVCDLRTGSLPVGSQSVLDSITESAREWNIDVTWYRRGGNPVGLFRFFANQADPASQICTLEVNDGRIVVGGRSAPDQSPVAMLGTFPLRGPGAE